MRVSILPLLCLLAAAAHAGAELDRAAALYHRGLYDSALSELQRGPSSGGTRRDSAAFHQYAGMAAARLGNDSRAVAEFRSLLDLDSLFQFPSNENDAILDAFRRAGTVDDPSDAAGPGVAAGGDRTESVRMARSGSVPAGSPFETGDMEGNGSGSASVSAGLTVGSPRSAKGPGGIGLAMGAIPCGGGWLAERRYPTGISLALLQAGGLALSLYASSQASALDRGPYRISTDRQLREARQWQWVQRVSLSVALGAYLYSLIASGRN